MSGPPVTSEYLVESPNLQYAQVYHASHFNPTGILLTAFFLLQEKRSIFPRFYFIGDDDLLEILGQSTNPTVIQTHLKKLFAGIHTVQFDDSNQNILAMRSLDGELVPLTKKIHITTSVEEWLKELSKEMVNTLQQLLINALQESRKQLGQIPIEKYPSQVSKINSFFCNYFIF